MMFKELGQKILNAADIIVIVSTISHDWHCKPTLKLLQKLDVLNNKNIINRRVVIQYDQPNCIRDMLLSNVEFDIKGKSNAAVGFYITLNHYLSMCNAWQSGAEHAMILENDCVMHKDISRLCEMLDSIPTGYDFINFNTSRVGMDDGVPEEYCGKGKAGYRKLLQDMLHSSHSGNTYFAEMTSTCRGANCYMMSRKFIKHMIKIFEDAFAGKKQLKLIDHNWRADLMPDMKMYISRFPLFMQKPSACQYSKFDTYIENYLAYGINEWDIVDL